MDEKPLWRWRRIAPAILAAALFWSPGVGGPAEGSARPGSSPYSLGEEQVPGGGFDKVGPRWEQLRPDEGERLAIVPPGWRVGYQGGKREMPHPGIDPESRDPGILFLYGAGQVDLITPVFPLEGPGVHLLSLRIKSIVNPASRALRILVRLLPSEEAGSAGPVLIERFAGTAPERAVWTTWSRPIVVPEGRTRAEIHLIKESGPADFLVDDVSLRRVESPPEKLTVDPAGGADPEIHYLGPLSGAVIRSLAGGGAPLEIRFGFSPEEDEGWTRWTRSDPTPALTPLPLPATGVPLYMMTRRPSSEDRSGAVTIELEPWSGEPLSTSVRIRSLEGPLLPPEGSWRDRVLPEADDCSGGELAPVRALAVRATHGLEEDLEAARALLGTLSLTLPFAGEPPSAGAFAGEGPVTPIRILEDCTRSTPLLCDRSWARDLYAAACGCIGLSCTEVRFLDRNGKVLRRGFDLWSDEEARWVFLAEGRPETGEHAGESAVSIARREGLVLEGATNQRWGRKGWVRYDPGGLAGGEDLAAPLTVTGESLEPRLNGVVLRLEAAGPFTLRVGMDHFMPGFARYEHRFSEQTPWEKGSTPLLWPLAPGENLLEVRGISAAGRAGRATRVRVRREVTERFQAYRGLRALGGDPHVHTGLGLYRILSPEDPLASGSPEETFASARENGLHWAAVTDYASHIDDPRTLRLREKRRNRLRNPDGGRTASEWEHLRAVVRASNEPGTFAAFLGVEYDGEGWTSHGGPGRKLILLPGESAGSWCSPAVHNRGDCPVVEDAYRYARAHGAVMIAATPCAAAGGEDTDWSRHDPVVSLLEIYGGACERGAGGLVDATVRRGLRIGAGGGSKDRTGRAGLYDRTICWAERLDRKSILGAIRDRRCYWSAAGHVDLKFTLNGAPIGSETLAAAPTTWSILAENLSAPAFVTLELLKDGRILDSTLCENGSRCFLEGGLGRAEPGVYYAAISDAEGERLVVSSPIFVGAGPKEEEP